MPRIKKEGYSNALRDVLCSDYKTEEVPPPFKLGQKVTHIFNGIGYVLRGVIKVRNKLVVYFPNATEEGRMTNLKGIFVVDTRYLLKL